MINVLSLFDGIGGARQALEELNIDCKYYASEIDKFAIRIAKSNHPDIKHIGDVKEVKKYSGIDLLIGGSPCQDLSIAKKDRKGLKGDRSGLFYEYLRILRDVKPKYFILENVASMSKEAKAMITKELFNIEPIMINSALLTAQNRKRLYWVGELIDGEYKQVKIEQPRDKEIYLKDIIEENVDEKYYMNDNQILNIKKSNYRDRKPMDINKKSNTLKIGGDKKRIIYKEKWRFLTPVEYCRLQGFLDDYVSVVSNTQAYKGLGNSFTVPVIKHLLKAIYSEEGKSVCLSANGGGRGAKTGLYCISSSQKNSTITQDKSSCLVSSMGSGGGHIPYLSEKPLRLNGSQKIDNKNYFIRKLTVNECCRLQGFPDDYVSMVSNTQGYKGLGNSFTVPVIKHLLKAIL